METYRHHISGFFARRSEAETVASQIIATGIPSSRVHIFDKSSVLPEGLTSEKGVNSSDMVLKDVLVDAAVGSAAGTGLGILVGVGLVAMNVTLFVASPLIAPLTLLGWGASLGGIVGASVGAAEKVKPLSDLVHDAILTGQVVIVVETNNADETGNAGKIIENAIGDYKDDAKPTPIS